MVLLFGKHNNRAFLRPGILLCSICIRFLCNWVGREYFFVPFAFINFPGSIPVPCSVYVFFLGSAQVSFVSC